MAYRRLLSLYEILCRRLVLISSLVFRTKLALFDSFLDPPTALSSFTRVRNEHRTGGGRGREWKTEIVR